MCRVNCMPYLEFPLDTGPMKFQGPQEVQWHRLLEGRLPP